MRNKIFTVLAIILCAFIVFGLILMIYTWNQFRNGKAVAQNNLLSVGDGAVPKTVLASPNGEGPRGIFKEACLKKQGLGDEL